MAVPFGSLSVPEWFLHPLYCLPIAYEPFPKATGKRKMWKILKELVDWEQDLATKPIVYARNLLLRALKIYGST